MPQFSEEADDMVIAQVDERVLTSGFAHIVRAPSMDDDMLIAQVDEGAVNAAISASRDDTFGAAVPMEMLEGSTRGHRFLQASTRLVAWRRWSWTALARVLTTQCSARLIRAPSRLVDMSLDLRRRGERRRRLHQSCSSGRCRRSDRRHRRSSSSNGGFRRRRSHRRRRSSCLGREMGRRPASRPATGARCPP